MAIRIIKEGKKTKFTKTCPDCGCEFEYEAEDLQVDYTICLTTYPCQYNTYVICPCCGKHIHHGTTYGSNWPWISPTWPTYPNYPYVTWTTTGIGTELDCNKCPNKPDPSKPVVGDTPCTWCKKNVPYCGDVFPAGYTSGQSSGIYSVDPNYYKKVTYTNSSYVSPTFASNYTTDIK